MRVCWRACLLVGLVACVWGGAGVNGTSAPLSRLPGPAEGLPGLRILHANRSGLALEWVAPPVRLLPASDGTVDVVAEGCARSEQPGEPRLPFASALIALPPGVEPSLRFLSVEETTLPLPAPLAAARQPEGAMRDGDGHPIGGTLAPANARDRAAACDPSAWPA
jgi:hypothetical protein